MRARVLLLTFGLTGAMTVSVFAAQHDAHQAGGTAPSAAQVGECRQAQLVVTELLNAALKRLEEARLTNSAAAMRDAADDVQAALLDMRTQLVPCSAMQASDTAVDPNAGHVMPSTPPSSAAAGTGASTDSHAGHVMPSASGAPAAPQRPAAPVADPHAGHATAAASARGPAPPKSPATTAAGRDAHAEHAAPAVSPKETGSSAARRPSAPAPPTNIVDLKCPNPVDARTAPRMLYQGRMYYFCTEASRAEFAKEPAKFVTAPPQIAPPHAH